MSNADPIARSYPSPAALQAQIVLLVAERDNANERAVDLASKLAAAERTAEVLRDHRRRLAGKLDAALLQRDEARESRNQALKERDAANACIASLHRRAVAATEALGIVYAPEGYVDSPDAE